MRVQATKVILRKTKHSLHFSPERIGIDGPFFACGLTSILLFTSQHLFITTGKQKGPQYSSYV